MSLLIKKLSVGYEDLVPSLQTGDIVLMHGQYVSSHLVEKVEHSFWSHSAIIVLASDLGMKSEDNVLLWESNIKQGKEKYKAEPVEDVIYNKEKNGPQLVSLRKRMKLNYEHKDDGGFAIRHLYAERTPAFLTAFKAVIDKYDSNPKYDPSNPDFDSKTDGEHTYYGFPNFKHEMLDPIKGRYFHKEVDNDTIFCSELVALTFASLGLLSSYQYPNAYIPADFTESNGVGLMKRAWLGNEIIIEPKSL